MDAPAPVWIVTGASRGIGAAVAHEAARRGARVALVARGEAVEGQAEAVRAAGGETFANRSDVAADDAAESIVAEVVERYGRIDVLVNNAAVHRGGRIERLDPGDFDAVLATDLRAPFRLCRAAVPHLREGSAIVNIGAVVGLRGFPGDAPYASAKAGLAGLTKVLAVELAGRGITANLVVPGFTDTELTLALKDHVRERLLGMIPVGRAADPREIAEVVAWVAASRYMTGAVVPVDGGLLATFGGG